MRFFAAMVALGLTAACDRQAASDAPAPRVATSDAIGATPDARIATPDPIDTGTESDQASSLTFSQKNAARSAEQYLSMSGFSRRGLIDQLSSDAGDGYSVTDATAAVDSLSVDWNANAARSAKQYLGMSGFSCKGLVEQLSSDAGDKYTNDQAAYGARQAGAC